MNFKKNGFLYVVSFDTGLIKIGRSYYAPESRISSHISIAKIGGAEFVESYIVESVSAPEDELKLIKMLSETNGAKQIRREWFYGVTFDDAKSMIDDVIKDSFDNYDPKLDAYQEEKRDVSFDDALDRFKTKKDISLHGHDWMACYPFAQELAKRINSHEETPEFFSSKVGASDVNRAELGLWILLYTSPIEHWFEYVIASEEHPGDVLYSAEKAVKEMLAENGML